MNWHYPATNRNNRAAWYTIIRRSVFFLPVWGAILLVIGFTYLGWGKQTAIEMWKDFV